MVLSTSDVIAIACGKVVLRLKVVMLCDAAYEDGSSNICCLWSAARVFGGRGGFVLVLIR